MRLKRIIEDHELSDNSVISAASALLYVVNHADVHNTPTTLRVNDPGPTNLARRDTIALKEQYTEHMHEHDCEMKGVYDTYMPASPRCAQL